MVSPLIIFNFVFEKKMAKMQAQSRWCTSLKPRCATDHFEWVPKRIILTIYLQGMGNPTRYVEYELKNKRSKTTTALKPGTYSQVPIICTCPIIRTVLISGGSYSHCKFIRLNPKNKGPIQFCLPVLLGIHRNSKQKEFFRFSEGFLI